MRIVIAGGGTAGHVNPALALAEALSAHEVSFIGTARGAEARAVPSAGFEMDLIEVKGFDRSRPSTLVSAGAGATRAVAASRSILRRRAADVVVGVGGYVSLPAVLAAATLRMPIVLHEQNVVLGLANRTTKRFARRVGVSFRETLPAVGRKGVWVGNPVAPGFVQLDRAAARPAAYERFGLDPGRRTLLVFGGSQGARTINEAAVGLARTWAGRDDVQVLHITGRAAHDALAEQVGDATGSFVYRLEAYVDDMAAAYAVADLALCRGGATTVAEITVVGLPSMIVPYPYHRDRQQERHGRILERAGAARVVLDADLNTDLLARQALDLLGDLDRLGSMGEAAKRMGRPDAAAALAGLVQEVAA